MGEGVSTTPSKSRQRSGSQRISSSQRINNRYQTTNRTQESPAPTTMADLNSRKFKAAVTRAHNYTDDNFHQVASATMAKAFGYPDIEKEFRQIEKEHESAGSLSAVRNGRERVRALEDEIEKRIRRDYGDAGIRAWSKGKS